LRNDVILDQYSFYLILVLLGIALFFAYSYTLSVLFKKNDFNPILSFISIIFAGVFLFIIFVEGISPAYSTMWHETWDLTLLSKQVILYAVIVPLLVLQVMVMLRETFRFLRGVKDRSLQHFLSVAGLSVFLLMLMTDYLRLIHSWDVLFSRVLLLIPMFAIYYIYSGNYIALVDEYVEQLPFTKRFITRRPVLLQAIIIIAVFIFGPLYIFAQLIIQAVTLLFANIDVAERVLLEQYMNEQMILIALMVGLLTFLLGMGWARTISMRLRSLFRGTQELSKGNFEYSLEEEGSRDEIRLLAHLFNKLSGALVAYKNEVIEKSEGLEGRVADRTAALAKKQDELQDLTVQHETLLNQLQVRSDIILNNIKDGLLLIDKNFCVKRVNEAFVQQFGKELTAFEGLCFSDISAMKEYSELHDAVEKMHAEQSEAYDLTISLQPPLVGDLAVRLSPMVLEDGSIGTMVLSRLESPPWGIIYNSHTREPIKLAMVRLIDEKTQRVIDTEVSDPDGRFGFFVSPGSYYLSVMKDGFHFPPKEKQGYRGEVIQVSSHDEGALNFTVFMDPLKSEDAPAPEIEDVTEAVEPAAEKKDLPPLMTVQELQKQQSE
jgi:PAS domain-containing protein